jgi:hypothetical protein
VKPTPFIIVGVYILMFVLAGFIFGAKSVFWILGGMLAIATVLYIAIIFEEKPWKFPFPGENFLAYAILAYCVVLFLLPIIALNIVEELKSDGKITWRWL